jgi:hypothetical protein
MTLYTNTAAGAEAVGQAYASIKIKTPNAYHRDRSKLQVFILQCETYM